ncbi:MAG: AMP-binding protein [Alphaproteobacteria bacterium]|nr:AMP-binding protein [Alphaproteobacteria bacterium]
MSANLYAAFRQRFPKNLEKPFIVTQDGTAISYSDIERQSSQFANLLISLGIRPGDRVAAQVEKSPAVLILYLGCLRVGATYLPLNTAYTGEELEYLVSDATPRLVVCDPACQEDAAERATRYGAGHCLTLDANGRGSLTDHASTKDDTFETIESAPDDLAAILYSSGTTGKPKGAMLSHGALAANAMALHAAWRFGPDDVLLHALPIFHTHGLFVATNTVLMNGTAMIFHSRFDPSAVIKDLSSATVFMGVPTYYTRLLGETALSVDACQSVRLFISGSAPLLDETFQTFATRTGHTIVERYGMTEAGIITSASPEKPRKAGTVGWPLDGVTLRIASDSNTPVAAGQTGGVQIKGSSLFSGYWNNPGKTAEEITSDGFFRTGDIGYHEDDGQITLVGRAKDMYISGGFNVFPKEIEQIVDSIDGVAESAIIGLPHPDFGEAGMAIVVAEEGESIDSESIRATLKATVANYKVPKLVVLAGDLPRNAMGKVQKNILRDTYRSRWDDHVVAG